MATDNWSADYEAARQSNLNQQVLLEMRQFDAQQQNIPNVTITGTSQPTQQEPMGVGKAIYEGAKAGVRNAVNAVDDLGNWLNDNIINLRTEQQQREYEVFKQTGERGYAQRGVDLSNDAPKPKEGVANFAYNVSEFLVGFVPALKAVRGLSGAAAVTKAGMIAEGAAAGAGGAFFSLDPKEERLSNMLNDNLPEPLKNPVTEYLAADPNDPAIEGRFKNALENAAFGVIGDVALNGLFKAVKAAKDTFIQRGIDPMAALKAATEKKVATTSIKGELDNILSAADEAAAQGGKQADVSISKELGDYLGKKGSAYDIESLRTVRKEMDDVPIPHAVSPETAGVLPQAPKAAAVQSTEQEVNSLVDALVSGKELTKEELGSTGINYSRVDTPEQLHNVLGLTADKLSERMAVATGGVRTLKETKALTEELGDLVGSTPEYLQNLSKDTLKLDARFQVAKAELVKSGNALLDLAQYARELNVSLSASTEEKQLALLALRKQAMIHGEIQAWVKGTQTEIARALSAMRITTQDARFTKEELGSLIEHFGGDKLNIEFANKIVSLADDPAKLNKLIRKSGWVKTLDMLQEVFTNSILSGPITHVTNIMGNSLRAVAGTAETAIAAGIGKTRRMLGSELDAADFNEAVAQAHGLVEGIKDIVDLVKSGKISEIGQFGGSKIDGGAFFDPAITAGNLGANADTFLGRLINGVGTTIRVPGMALQLEDNLFKQINVRSSLRQNAYRQAKSEGLYGDTLTKRIAELVNDPPENLMTKAHEDALDAVFAKSLEKDGGMLDRMGIWLQTAKNEGVNGKALVPGLHFIVPFIKTPTNILKYAWDRMPILGLINQQNINILKQGGREADLLLAKQTMGATALMIGSYLASQDMITGGLPQLTKGQKEVGGKQAYSIKIGDKWVSYNRVDPIGMFLGLAADFANLSGNVDEFTRDELAYAAVAALGTNLGSKTYLQGLFNTIGAISDAAKGQTAGIEKWASSMVNGMTPFYGLRNQGNKAFGDDVVREVNGLFDKWKATIPGYSTTLPPHRNLLTGAPIVYEGGMGIDIASPFYTKTEVNDPAANEISRLKLKFFQHPPKRFNGIDLSNDQYDRLMVLMTQDIKPGGKTMHAAINAAVTSSAWNGMTEGQNDGENYYPGTKEFTIQKIFNAYKQAAWANLVAEDPELKKKFVTSKTNKANTFLGLPVQAVNQ